MWKFLVRLMYSGYDFVWLYEHRDQISFLDGRVRVFNYFGGIPERVVYDNLEAAVRKPLVRDRKLTDRFQALASHYVFEPCFTRAVDRRLLHELSEFGSRSAFGTDKSGERKVLSFGIDFRRVLDLVPLEGPFVRSLYSLGVLWDPPFRGSDLRRPPHCRNPPCQYHRK